jgi:hypothetical protein
MNELKINKSKTAALTESEVGKPTTLERILVAAVLRLAPQDQGKTPMQLLQLATKYWEADRKLRDAEPERSILVATVAQMKDEGHLFASQPSDRRKGCPSLPNELWMERMESFPGDKHELLLELLSVEVPRKQILKELFPAAELSRTEEMKKLLKYAGGVGAATFVGFLVSRLVESRPEAERCALLTAITTGDVNKAYKWLAASGFSQDCLERLVVDLKFIRMGIKEGCMGYDMYDTPVPGLICRWLIKARQMQISGKRADAGRKKGANPSGQSGPGQNRTRREAPPRLLRSPLQRRSSAGGHREITPRPRFRRPTRTGNS